ncbi:MAG: hypothetical protein PHX38_02055 [Sulfuricella sp.]|nr:hypothetical protein [Sulfuricella sp.]
MQISDILIHVDETLDTDRRQALEERVRTLPGVLAPRFNPGRDHLLLVAFDPERTRISDLLGEVVAAGYRAQLVGA